MRKGNSVGYEFEKTLKGIFKNIQAKHPFFWHQFADSKAARGFINSQPSDFLITSPVLGTMLIEAKASEETSSLANCAKKVMRPSQVGQIKKWQRAGSKSLVIFYCQIDNKVEIWGGDYVVECISNSIKLEKQNAVEVDYFHLESYLTELFTKV